MTLTINIDEKKLQKVRSIVERRGETIEKTLEDYLDNLLRESWESHEIENKDSKISRMQRISELQNQAGIKPVEDFDDKADYREHIIRKNA